MITTALRQNTRRRGHLVLAALAAALWALAGTAHAAPPDPAAAETRADIGKTLGFVPKFFLEMPEAALPGTWAEMKGLQLNPQTTLSGKTKELIGLGVSSQIPCRYCIIAHTEFAKLSGAAPAEVGEAITMAAITRHWSTFLNGIQTDEAKFRAEIAKLVDGAKKAAAAGGAPPAPGPLPDGAAALRDIGQTLGMTPDFLRRFPDAGRAGAWRTMRDVQLGRATALPAKDKELIGLAVSAQVPCRFCIIAHTEFAKLAGATNAEITEAVAMAAFTRHMSTLLNGAQTDEAAFRRDVDRLVKGAKAAKAAADQKTAKRSATAAAR